jgi:hypothetical protein
VKRTVIVGAALAIAACGGAPEDSRVPRDMLPSGPVPCPHRQTMDTAAPPTTWDARALIGMTADAAAGEAKRHGCVLRIAWEDGEGSNLTADAQINRIDIAVLDGRIVGVQAS